MSQKTPLHYALPVIILSTLLVVAIIYAWTGPTSTPPQGNVPAPLNVGDSYQLKTGPLTIGNQFITTTSTFLATLGGNVGIGTTAPRAKLHVSVEPEIFSDGFEDGTLPPFTTGGDANWTVTGQTAIQGKYSATAIINELGKHTWMKISKNIKEGGGNIIFSIRVRYGYLYFYIDGVRKGEWHGEIPWRTVSYDVNGGSHTFTWVYWGVGKAWVDDVQIAPVIEEAAVFDGNVCIGNDCRLSWPPEIIAVHSQYNYVPDCPPGWERLWSGYSLVGSFLDSGREAFNDLGSPGSCVEEFHPIPFIECSSPNTCDYFTGRDFAMWLSTISSDKEDISGVENIRPYISRCSVCKKSAKLVVRHSFSSTTPSCPAGSKELWNGYSFHGAYLSDGYNSSQDLKSPGSCLKEFRPIPVIECGDNPQKCDYFTPGDSAMWLGTDTGDTGRISGVDNILPHISRCVVCEY